MTEDTYVPPRSNVLPWDDTFMALACIIKERSKDPSTQVGAVIVTEDKRILSLGYNGTPNGFDDNEINWARENADGDETKTKYPYVVHAEDNAISNFRGSNREFAGATIYVTHFCCEGCAKRIIQVGIKHVVYLNMKDNRGLTSVSERLFSMAGVSYRQFVSSSGSEFGVTINGYNDTPTVTESDSEVA